MQRSILISGASGLIGSAVKDYLTEKGYRVSILVRRPPKSDQEIFWNPDSGDLDSTKLESFYGVIHLSGAGIADRRWTEHRKYILKKSRIKSTTLLVDQLKKVTTKPTVFISASGVGFYGDRKDEILTESSARGDGFLSDLAIEWEGAANSGKDFARVVILRLGMVISKDGGALKKMLLPFKFGLGGVLGSGDQFMSWIHIKDLLRVIVFAIETPAIKGIVNTVSPDTPTNLEFTKTLGEILNRPTFLSAPKFLLKILLGQMADELLLASTRVAPEKLTNAEFKFQFPQIKDALSEELSNL